MENASKAMYMAAGVLIAIMVLGVFVFLFRAGGKFGTNYEEKQTEEQLRLFNSKFENFARDNNTISDMISVTNLAIDNNEKNYYNSLKSVLITFKSVSSDFYIKTTEPMERNYVFFREALSEKKLYMYDLMEELSVVDMNMNYKYLFKCTKVKYREANGRIEEMRFEVYENEKYDET